MFRLIATKKSTKEQIVLEDNLTEAAALKFCEMWGWSYDDGQHSYWLGYEEA